MQDRILIIETKRADEINDAVVLRKAETAALWAHIATEFHAKKIGGKPWSYLLVPHTEVVANSTLAGLAAKYTRQADTELLTRYELSNELNVALQA
ncbi:hypothetical protein D3C85_1346370 [compost metagenome]